MTTMESARKSKCCGQYLRDTLKLVVLHSSSQADANAAREREKKQIEKNLISLFYIRIKKVQENLCRAAMFSIYVKERNKSSKTSNVAVSFKVSNLLCLSHAKKSCLPKLWENSLPDPCWIDEDSSCVFALSSMIAIKSEEKTRCAAQS